MIVGDNEIAEHQIRIHNDKGELTAAGFWWVEPRVGFIKFMNMTAAWIGVVGVLAALVGLISMSKSPQTTAACAWIAGGCFLACWLIIKWMRPRHASRMQLVFHDNGTMELSKRSTQSWTAEPEMFVVPKSHMAIDRIELEPMLTVAGGQWVADLGGVSAAASQISLYFDDGQTGVVTQNMLDQNAARLITGQLRLALEEIRESMAERN